METRLAILLYLFVYSLASLYTNKRPACGFVGCSCLVPCIVLKHIIFVAFGSSKFSPHNHFRCGLHLSAKRMINTQPTNDVRTTLIRLRFNLLTSFQHPYNVVLTSCAGWVWKRLYCFVLFWSYWHSMIENFLLHNEHKTLLLIRHVLYAKHNNLSKQYRPGGPASLAGLKHNMCDNNNHVLSLPSYNNVFVYFCLPMHVLIRNT